LTPFSIYEEDEIIIWDPKTPNFGVFYFIQRSNSYFPHAHNQQTPSNDEPQGDQDVKGRRDSQSWTKENQKWEAGPF